MKRNSRNITRRMNSIVMMAQDMDSFITTRPGIVRHRLWTVGKRSLYFWRNILREITLRRFTISGVPSQGLMRRNLYVHNDRRKNKSGWQRQGDTRLVQIRSGKYLV